MSGWLVFAGLLLFPMLALALTYDIPTHTAAAGLVDSLPGTPLSLEQVEERSHRLASGQSALEIITSKVYRHSSGKWRVDSESRIISGQSSTSDSRTLLIDPSTGSRVVLLSSEKTAYRVFGPKAGEKGFMKGGAGIGGTLPSGHRWTNTTEALGKRTIEGIEFQGRRVVLSAEDDPGLTSTIERWYSDRLKLTGLAVASGPYGTHTARIQHLDWGEPDPALFAVPPDYKIVDVPLPSPDSAAGEGSTKGRKGDDEKGTS